MKYLLRLILIFIIAFTLIGCNSSEKDDDMTEVVNENDPTDVINIYMLNDLHGAIYESTYEPGISKIGEYLINEKTEHPNSTVIISAGDMFQGTAVSSMTRGNVVVNVMNKIGFDAMTIGNHEFDWGIDNIIKFNDNNVDNGEANFPLLGANIYRKSTNEITDWAKPYTVIERGGLRIGIIGTLGEDETNDILATYVADYEFHNQLEVIQKYTKILRTDENCDIVIVSSHSDTSPINSRLVDLDGEYRVDAVLNGHTHRYYASEDRGTRSVSLPSVQSGNNGKYIGKITLEINKETKEVTDAYSSLIDAKSQCTQKNADIDNILSGYSTEFNASIEVLGESAQYVDRTTGAYWAADTIRKYADSDLGVVNYGGIRDAAFPFKQGQNVTFGDVFRMMPFENTIVTVDLTGAQIKSLINMNSDLYFSSNLSRSQATLNGTQLIDDQLYEVATIDYVFEKSSYPFKQGENINYTKFLFRDQLVNEIKASVSENGKWYID